MADNHKVIRIRRSRGLNLGVMIFVIIIIYVIFNIYSYLTADIVAEYEVGQGAIATNHVYRALALRDETIVYAGQSGYLNYYMKNGMKASVNDVIYTIDTTGEIAKKIAGAASDGSSLNKNTLAAIGHELELFSGSYDSNDFTAVHTFCVNLNSELSQTLSIHALNDLSRTVMLAEANNTFYRKTSDGTGIIVYYIDGYENVTVDKFMPEHMNFTGYSKRVLDTRTEISTGEPVYKRIGSEDWNLILSVSENMAKQLSEEHYVKIRFCKDNYIITVPCAVLKISGNYYLNLSLQTAMIRYVNDRFVDVELVLTEMEGLKIPISAITSKEFFTVPKKYFTHGGDSVNPGLLIQEYLGSEKQVKLVTPTIYYEKNDFYYIDDEYVKTDDLVVMSDSLLTYKIGRDTDSLTGVYNINKGYAVFKQINILSQNESYAIIETGQSYGIALYDHIALDGSKLHEDQLIAR